MSFNTWISKNTQIMSVAEKRQQRAILAWNRILEKPTIVNFYNSAGVLQTEQTVRLESDSRSSPSKTASGQAPRRKLIVFGIRDHPTLADTVMDEFFYFNVGNDRYVIQDVVETLGEVQGIAEATR